MKAIYIKEFGSIEGLEFRKVPDLSAPVENQVLVRVRAAGLNRADLLQVRGLYAAPPGYSSNIPGLEFAGEIAAVGDKVSGFRTGDRVFGITAGEAQAKYLLIDASLLTIIPDNLDFTHAAAVPEAFITAHDAVFTLGDLQPGETLLIHAVGSGVGLAALQMAHAKGAVVIGTSRTPDKLSRCDQYGLDYGIATENGSNFAVSVNENTGERGADVILDLVGAAYFEENLASLAVKGRLILVGLTSGAKAEFNLGVALHKRIRIIGTVLRGRTVEEKAEATRRFAKDAIPMLEAGTVKPNLDRVFQAADAVAAYKYLESNESFGKVVMEF